MGINLYLWVLFVCLFKSIEVEKKAHYSWLHIHLDGYHFSKYDDNEILLWEQVYPHWQNYLLNTMEGHLTLVTAALWYYFNWTFLTDLHAQFAKDAREYVALASKQTLCTG